MVWFRTTLLALMALIAFWGAAAPGEATLPDPGEGQPATWTVADRLVAVSGGHEAVALAAAALGARPLAAEYRGRHDPCGMASFAPLAVPAIFQPKLAAPLQVRLWAGFRPPPDATVGLPLLN